MLKVSKLIASAEECLGWPYVSPGTNDQRGIDCSGLFVKCYRDQGAQIYHGSNTIYYEYCSEKGKLTSANQLKPGMAVFKTKAWTDADRSNKWYGREPGNQSHIGLVISANPLKIIHASSVSGKVIIDTKLGKWAYWGWLKDVEKEGSAAPIVTPEPAVQPADNAMPILKKGTKGEYVQLLQTKLIMFGYNLGSYGADGDFGKATDAAVREFQTNAGLNPDGIVGPLTWAALDQGYMAEDLYTVILNHLHLSEVKELEHKYGEIQTILE